MSVIKISSVLLILGGCSLFCLYKTTPIIKNIIIGGIRYLADIKSDRYSTDSAIFVCTTAFKMSSVI
jgi:hypothetical protein